MRKSHSGQTGHAARIIERIEQSPPITAVEALRRNLLHAMFKGITTDDMQEIVQAQVRRAKKGNGPAFERITKLFLAAQESPSEEGRSFQQAIIVNGQERDRSVDSMDELRRRIVRVIASSGPLQSERIHEDHLGGPQGNIDFARVCEALEGNKRWFERQADGWHITTDARSHVLPQKKE